ASKVSHGLSYSVVGLLPASLRQASSPPSFEGLRPNPHRGQSPQRGQNKLKIKRRFMKPLINSRAGALLATGLGVGLLLGGASQFIFAPAVLQARAEQTPQPDVREPRHAQIETNSLDGLLPDQAHAITDVGYHFANLWFAADKQ